MISRCRLHSMPLHNNSNQQMQTQAPMQMPVQELEMLMPVQVMQMQMLLPIIMRKPRRKMTKRKMEKEVEMLVPEPVTVLVARPSLDHSV